MAPQLIYFADPMCSWCWGFAPEIVTLAEAVEGRARLRLVMGGLRAGNTEAMDDAQKAMISGHWRHVAERSGQPFDFAFFERDGFVYDTEPACRAVVAARGLAPDLAFALFRRIQRAFYAEGQDVTDAGVLADLAAEVGLERAAFADAFDMDATRDATGLDFMITQQTGVSGFPTVLAGVREQGFHVISAGYAKAETLLPKLDAVMTELG